jgi:hypothetical protein
LINKVLVLSQEHWLGLLCHYLSTILTASEMTSDPKRVTVLPDQLHSLWSKRDGVLGEQPRQQGKSLETSSAYHQGVPIEPGKFEKRSDHRKLSPPSRYHKSYLIDQAGPGVIALKDTEKLPICLIKYCQPQKQRSPLKLQFASHKNLVSLIDHFQSGDEVQLIYEYEHLAISLGCVAGAVSFSEADIATICKEVLEGLKYVHTVLSITYGLLDFSNILITWQGEVKLGIPSAPIIQTKLISGSKYRGILAIGTSAGGNFEGFKRSWLDRRALERSYRSTA